FVDVLARMGASVDQTDDTTTVTGAAPLHGVEVDMSDLSDTASTLAVVAAFASTPTRVTGIGFIRAKESDRVGGVVRDLRRRGIDPDEVEPVAHLAIDLELEVVDTTVKVDGHDASLEIRGPEVTRAVSVVAANPLVRTELRRRQIQWAQEHGGGVIEGRDIGSVVFPDAELKLYLTAAREVRAGRPHKDGAD